MQIKSNYIDIFHQQIFPAKIIVEDGRIKSIEKIEEHSHNLSIDFFNN